MPWSFSARTFGECIPQWSALEPKVQAAWERAGWGELWYAECAGAKRLAHLVVWARLIELGIEGWVAEGAETDHPGCVECWVRDEEAFWRAMGEHCALTRVGRGWWPGERRSVRELGLGTSLHIKTFHAWPSRRVQFHIDRFGCVPSTHGLEAWGASLRGYMRHMLSWASYRDARLLCAASLREGRDLMCVSRSFAVTD